LLFLHAHTEFFIMAKMLQLCSLASVAAAALEGDGSMLLQTHAVMAKKGKKGSLGSSSLGSILTANIWAQNVMPQSVDEALKTADWAEVDAAKGCHPKFGRRFQRKGVMTPTLMYDNTGHIAGMQYAINTDEFPLYPDSNLKAGESVVKTGLSPDQGDYALTTYFMDPHKICTASFRDHVAGSIGDRLWVANESAPGGHEVIPLRDDDGVPDGYVPSGCAESGFAYEGSPGMGTHWWRMTEPNGMTPCKDAGSMFLLYSRGHLVSIGMVFVGFKDRVPTAGNVRPVEIADNRLTAPGDEMWEFARQDLSPFFFGEHDNPKCLHDFNSFDKSIEGGDTTTGTLHVFFSDPFDITCP